MNRNTAIVLALIIASGLVIGYLFVLPLLTPPTMSTLVQFHDKDGNLVNVPMAIQSPGGEEVTKMTVTVTWNIEEANIEPDTFNLWTKIHVNCKDRAGEWQFAASKTFPYIKETSSSRSIEWTLVNILDMTLDDIGWELEIWAELVATATDTNGDPVREETNTAPIYPTLTWSVATGTLNIVSCTVLETYA